MCQFTRYFRPPWGADRLDTPRRACGQRATRAGAIPPRGNFRGPLLGQVADDATARRERFHRNTTRRVVEKRLDYRERTPDTIRQRSETKSDATREPISPFKYRVHLGVCAVLCCKSGYRSLPQSSRRIWKSLLFPITHAVASFRLLGLAKCQT